MDKKIYEGSKEADIDWDQVDRLLEAGCLGTEVAAYFGLHPNTLYQRVEKKFGCGFREFLQLKRSKGDGLLRTKQFQEAMTGDKSMLIWLGKNRLKQSEKQDMNVSANLSDFKGWVKMQDNEEKEEPEGS